MKRTLAVAALVLLWACTSSAQTSINFVVSNAAHYPYCMATDAGGTWCPNQSSSFDPTSPNYASYYDSSLLLEGLSISHSPLPSVGPAGTKTSTMDTFSGDGWTGYVVNTWTSELACHNRYHQPVACWVLTSAKGYLNQE